MSTSSDDDDAQQQDEMAPEGEPAPVALEREDWVRVLNAAEKGLDEIPEDQERERADELLDEIVDQAHICEVDLMALEYDLRRVYE